MTELKDAFQRGLERGLIKVHEGMIAYHFSDQRIESYPFSNELEQLRAGLFCLLVLKFKYPPRFFYIPKTTTQHFLLLAVRDSDKKNKAFLIGVVDNEPFESRDLSPFLLNQDLENTAFLVHVNPNQLQWFQVVVQNDALFFNEVSSIPVFFGREIRYKFFKGQNNGSDLKSVSFAVLTNVFNKCHDILWSGGRIDPSIAFDEMTKLLFAKIYDERFTPEGSWYQFQVGDGEDVFHVCLRVRELFASARRLAPFLFDDFLGVSDFQLFRVVEVLESISLVSTDIDSKGQAFETFLGVVFRGRLGQYFTRRQIVEFIVDFLKPTVNDVILDPSCGSGGFLLYSLKKVFEGLRTHVAVSMGSLNSEQLRNEFAKNHLFGIEINKKIARVAMMDLIINNVNHLNIEHNTGLNSEFKNPRIKYNSFTLILTNPPFGVKIKQEDKETLGKNSFQNFELAKRRTTILSDVLFLEQYHKFLVNDTTKNPRVGVVLQVGILNNPSNKFLLHWLKRSFKILGVVGLPEFAFKKAGSGMKTVILFLQKYQTPYASLQDIPDYEIFFALANHIGYDSTLRQDKNELPAILEQYEKHLADGVSTIWVRFSDLDYRLDPKYYLNKERIKRELKEIQEHGVPITPLSAVLDKLDSGKSPKGGVLRSTGEIVSITIKNLSREGTFDFTNTVSFVPASFFEDFKASRGELQIGDILIAKDGATTGKTAIITKDAPFVEEQDQRVVVKAIFSEHVFRLRVNPSVNPFYVNAFINSELGQLQLETLVSGGAQGGITQEFAQHFMLPIPDKRVQAQIATMWANGIAEIQELLHLSKEKLREIKKQVLLLLKKNE